ncbi:7-carboxy-7-deazaguanine synthase [uncultured archaeon]|nr:7-carboxy-7-deazaguanine synthase [uncultured archaeon]
MNKIIDKGRVKVIEFYAKLRNKRLYCAVLNGGSTDNIVINSDMTVSCSCNDLYGLGKMGNLKKQSLKEIFSGEKADFFRKSLAKGKIPIINCLFCSGFWFMDKNIARIPIPRFNTPKGIKVENTVNCNLNCLSCNRKMIYSQREKRNLTLEDIKKIAFEIKKNKIKEVQYSNLGEPFFSEIIKKELGILKKYNPGLLIHILTNGILIDSKEKQNAALMADHILFSIHGSTQKSVEKYQRGANFDKAYNNMKDLVKLRNSLGKTKPRIIWKYVLFRWNDGKKLILNAINLAKKAGVDEICFDQTLSPPFGISFKSYLGGGYLNKISKFKNKIIKFDLRKESNI